MMMIMMMIMYVCIIHMIYSRDVYLSVFDFCLAL